MQFGPGPGKPQCRRARPDSQKAQVISVIVAAELLQQARLDPRRLDIAASWIDRRMVDVDGRTERIRAGTVDLLDRCERMIALTDE